MKYYLSAACGSRRNVCWTTDGSRLQQRQLPRLRRQYCYVLSWYTLSDVCNCTPE